MKKISCPNCGKELIGLEPYEPGESTFWCDNCNMDILVSEDQNYESTDKMVSHPDHYQSTNGLEVIDAIEAFTDGLNGIEATDTGNIIKYACRWHKKNGIQDLEKILWYTQHLINHLKKKESNN